MTRLANHPVTYTDSVSFAVMQTAGCKRVMTFDHGSWLMAYGLWREDCSTARVSRDHRKLKVFTLADDLVTRIYQTTRDFPVGERFGLQAQLRRAAISVACNIVEGSARRSTNEYVNFLNIAAASASEARYLVDVSRRLGFLSDAHGGVLTARYTERAARLNALMQALSRGREP